MIEDSDLDTYLYICSNKFIIFLFDKKKIKNLYHNEINFDKKQDVFDFQILSKFLEENVFKIEKLIGKFIKNIYLVIENNKVSNLEFGIKKKNYEKIISQKYLENTLTEAKDLFKENYQKEKILHIIIKKYVINDKIYSKFRNGLNGDQISLEIEFIYISNTFASLLEKVLEKFQISIIKYLDGHYIKKFFQHDDLLLSEMISRIKDGHNENEIRLIPKNKDNFGFFERFFQLFS